MKIRASFCALAVFAHLTTGVLTVATSVQAIAAEGHQKHKMRSAGFIATALEKKGFKVDEVRRHAQVYFVKVSEGGNSAILAIDGYSAELIGLKILELAPGTTAKSKGSGGNKFVDITYEFGYVVEISVYESYVEYSSEEISSTEEYTEVTYEESQEVTYEQVEEEASADLDEGTPEDAAGDQEADANASADDGTADDVYDQADDGGADDAGGADDGGADDGGADDGGADDAE